MCIIHSYSTYCIDRLFQRQVGFLEDIFDRRIHQVAQRPINYAKALFDGTYTPVAARNVSQLVER